MWNLNLCYGVSNIRRSKSHITKLSTGTKLLRSFCVRCAYNTKTAPYFGPVTKALNVGPMRRYIPIFIVLLAGCVATQKIVVDLPSTDGCGSKCFITFKIFSREETITSENLLSVVKKEAKRICGGNGYRILDLNPYVGVCSDECKNNTYSGYEPTIQCN